MATWDGNSGGTSGSGFFSPIPGSRELSPRTDSILPDTEENVVDQSEDVIRNFMFQRYQEDKDAEDAEVTPSIPELTHFTSSPMSQASNVGRQLAIIGDDINRRYSDTFQEMIGKLEVTDDTAYEVFANVAKKLFSDGINWGRIAALLCFAYRLAVQKLKQKAKQFADFLGLVIQHVVRFIKEKIASWIAQQGGWVAALSYAPTVSRSTIALIAGSCFLAIAAAVYFSKKGS